MAEVKKTITPEDIKTLREAAVDILLNPGSGVLSVQLQGDAVAIATLFTFVFIQNPQFYDLMKMSVELFEKNKKKILELAKKAGMQEPGIRTAPSSLIKPDDPQDELAQMVSKLKDKKGKEVLN